MQTETITTSVLYLGLSLPELRALGLDADLTLRGTHAGALGAAPARPAALASALNLPSRGNSQATIERILSYYGKVAR